MTLKELFVDSEIFNLDTIVRWDLNQIVKNETVSQHSFWVALFSTCLAEELFPDGGERSIDLKLQISRYALFHDLGEAFTGDINHTVKNNPFNGKEISEKLKELEEWYFKKKFSEDNPVSKMMLASINLKSGDAEIVKNIVKICDWLSFLKFLNNEKSLGNSNFDAVIVYSIAGLTTQIQKTKDILVKTELWCETNLSVLDNLL